LRAYIRIQTDSCGLFFCLSIITESLGSSFSNDFDRTRSKLIGLYDSAFSFSASFSFIVDKRSKLLFGLLHIGVAFQAVELHG